MRWLCAFALLFLLAGSAPGHGGKPPLFNSPAIAGACFTWEHDQWEGAEFLTLWGAEYGETGRSAYVTLNGSDKGYPVDCLVDWPSAYLSAGEIGSNVHIDLVLEPFGELDPTLQGYIVWATAWSDPWWTAWGWVCIDASSIYAVWQLSPDTEQLVTADGTWIGWRREFVIPDVPELVGASVYFLGLVYDPLEDEGSFSGTWRNTFTAKR